MKIRKAKTKDAPQIAKIHVDGWRSRYKGILSDIYLDSMKYEKREKHWNEILNGKDESAYVLENDDSSVIGFVSIRRSDEIDGYQAEVHALYLLDEFQGRGLGKMLLQSAVEILLRSGIDSMIIWALEANPTCQLYEKLRGIIVSSRTDIIGYSDYPVVCYGYKNISSLLR